MNDLINEDNNAGPAILISSVVPFGFLSSILQQGIVSVVDSCCFGMDSDLADLVFQKICGLLDSRFIPERTM